MDSKKPYLGITGCSTRREVSLCSMAFAKFGLSRSPSHQAMLGFLISHKLFDKRYPEKREYITIQTAFDLIGRLKFEEIFRTIHYNTPNKDFASEIVGLLETWGIFNEYYVNTQLFELIDGIQLNILNPSAKEIAKIKESFPNLSIILQLEPNSFILSKDYVDCIDYVLIDASRGSGKAIDLFSKEIISKYLEIKKTFENKIIGFAGGFNGENIKERYERIREILKEGDFSIDSQSSLRNASNELDLVKMESYVSEFVKSLKQRERIRIKTI